MNALHRQLLAAFLLSLLAVGVVPPSSGAEVPKAPGEICPILLGSTIPSVTVRSVEGDPLDLKEVVRGKPTILIFYRGGW